MLILNYSDITDDIADICKEEKVILDLKLWDIESTMVRNVKICAKLGAYAVTVTDHPLNSEGIIAAKQAGKKYGIKIIVGDISC